MELFNLDIAKERAAKYPDGLDIYNKLYKSELTVPASNTVVPVVDYLRFDKNAWFLLYAISASYDSAVTISRADSPFVRFTDTRNGKVLSNTGTNYIQTQQDGYIKIEGNFTPGLITEPLTNNNLGYLFQLVHLFGPLSQMKIEVINPNGGIEIDVKFCFKGFVMREGKV